MLAGLNGNALSDEGVEADMSLASRPGRTGSGCIIFYMRGRRVDPRTWLTEGGFSVLSSSRSGSLFVSGEGETSRVEQICIRGCA